MTCRQSKGVQVTREDWDRLPADIEVALAVPSSRPWWSRIWSRILGRSS